MITPEALRKLYISLGGDSSEISGKSKNVELLNAIAELLDAPDRSITIPKAVDMIASGANGYVKPTGTKGITENGNNIDVTNYAKVNVNVPASAVVSGTKDIYSNGTNIDVTQYAKVNVDVPLNNYCGAYSVTAAGGAFTLYDAEESAAGLLVAVQQNMGDGGVTATVGKCPITGISFVRLTASGTIAVYTDDAKTTLATTHAVAAGDVFLEVEKDANYYVVVT